MDVFDSLHSELQFRKIQKRGTLCSSSPASSVTPTDPSGLAVASTEFQGCPEGVTIHACCTQNGGATLQARLLGSHIKTRSMPAHPVSEPSQEWRSFFSISGTAVGTGMSLELPAAGSSYLPCGSTVPTDFALLCAVNKLFHGRPRYRWPTGY